MIKCEICGRTIDEIVEQDGNVTVQSDMSLICDRCQKREELKQQTEILRKAMAYDKIKKQLDCQKEIWNKLKDYIKKYQDDVVWKNKVIDDFQYDLIDKMQELEEGFKDGK